MQFLSLKLMLIWITTSSGLNTLKNTQAFSKAVQAAKLGSKGIYTCAPRCGGEGHFN